MPEKDIKKKPQSKGSTSGSKSAGKNKKRPRARTAEVPLTKTEENAGSKEKVVPKRKPSVAPKPADAPKAESNNILARAARRLAVCAPKLVSPSARRVEEKKQAPLSAEARKKPSPDPAPAPIAAAPAAAVTATDKKPASPPKKPVIQPAFPKDREKHEVESETGTPSLSSAFLPKKVPSLASKLKEPTTSLVPSAEPDQHKTDKEKPKSKSEPKEVKAAKTVEEPAPSKPETPVAKPPSIRKTERTANSRRSVKEKVLVSVPASTRSKSKSRSENPLVPVPRFDLPLLSELTPPSDNDTSKCRSFTPKQIQSPKEPSDDNTPTVFERIDAPINPAATPMKTASSKKRKSALRTEDKDTPEEKATREEKASDDEDENLKTPPSPSSPEEKKDDSLKQVRSVYMPTLHYYTGRSP